VVDLNFMDMLHARWDKGMFVCVGLDSDERKIPDSFDGRSASGRMIAFNESRVKATCERACAYKLNMAFYERLHSVGLQALEYSIRNIRRIAPDVPVILDAKRGDIGNSTECYAEALEWGDAVTVPPYMGWESLKPLLDQKNKGVFVLCRTSNPGAGEFQDLPVLIPRDEAVAAGAIREDQELGSEFVAVPLYVKVAINVAAKWNYNSNCGVVAGVSPTAIEELVHIRKLVGDMPILMPGIGAQGGDLEAAVKAGASKQRQGMLVNNSREIIFADNPGAASLKMHNDITAALAAA
jgi:orotidine-5'-phosphate decarboxylase